MTNHVHIAIQVGEVSLSRIMQNLTFRYTRWINWRQKRSGHLFQGRFKADFVDADSYLLELTRYIHLNPVRAGMVQFLEEYTWSGHRAYLGSEIIPWITTEWVLSQFAGKSERARRGYREFNDQGQEEGHQQEYHSEMQITAAFSAMTPSLIKFWPVPNNVGLGICRLQVVLNSLS